MLQNYLFYCDFSRAVIQFSSACLCKAQLVCNTVDRLTQTLLFRSVLQKSQSTRLIVLVLLCSLAVHGNEGSDESSLFICTLGYGSFIQLCFCHFLLSVFRNNIDIFGFPVYSISGYSIFFCSTSLFYLSADQAQEICELIRCNPQTQSKQDRKARIVKREEFKRRGHGSLCQHRSSLKEKIPFR